MTAFKPLIQAPELMARMSDVLLLDARFDLANPQAGAAQYAVGHLPGAHHVDLERDLSGAKTGRNGRHPLPERAAWAQRLAGLGLQADQPVVAYDAQGGMFAARVWWMLRWLGHAHVSVLDGGLPAWEAAGGAVTAEPPALPVASIAAALDRPALVHTVGSDELMAHLSRWRVLDARAPERFRGDSEPLDARAGHIPGALNRFFRDNLGPDGCFKSPETLQADYAALLAGASLSDVVAQCGSGVTACHNLLAMTHAGLDGARLYPGSWSEWSADPTRPVALGA